MLIISHEIFSNLELMETSAERNNIRNHSEVFPTQYSVLSSAAIGDHISHHYGLKILNCRLLIHNVGDTYLLVAETEKYIFKVYRDAHRSLNEIKAELELLQALYSGGAKVARPLPDLKADLIQAFNAAEGKRFGVLFAYAHGAVHSDLTQEQLITVGREMAVIHNISASVELSYARPEYNIETTLHYPLKVIQADFESMKEEYAFLKSTCDKLIKRMADFDLTKFSYGYCHYDYLPKNFHFQHDGSVTFFDFDFAGKGHYVNDFASVYAHFFLNVIFNKMTQEEADRDFKTFLDAYKTVRPISEEEIKAIPYFGFAWWMFYFGFHHDNFEDWSNFFYHSRFIRERVGWLRKWAEWYL